MKQAVMKVMAIGLLALLAGTTVWAGDTRMPGRMMESDAAEVQASERLRHKARPVTVWNTEEVMMKLRHRGPKPATMDQIGTTPAEPPRYEVADCGTADKPMVCCSYTEGDTGSSCNMFKLLCKNKAGGVPDGGAGAATCSEP